MKKFIALISTMAIAAIAAADSPKDPQAWNKLEVFRINKEAPAAFFLTSAKLEDALKPISIDAVKDIWTGDSYKLLNGDWKFKFLDSSKNVNEEFFARNFNDASWDTLDVPNSWQCKGYDNIFYNNTTMEYFYDKITNRTSKDFQSPPKGSKDIAIAAKNPYIPEDYRQVGIYRRTFSVPANWNGKNVFVRFNGVRTGFNLYVNGKFIGYSEDSFTPAEFNITKFVDSGENSIAVEVFKFTTGSCMEMQDMPHTMGIIRDVILVARPKVYIRDYFAPTTLSDDFKSAKIDFNVWIKNLSSEKSEGCVLKAYLVTSKGNIFGGEPLFTKKIAPVNFGEEIEVKETAIVKNFKLWSPDSPNLYSIVFQLSDANGKELESIHADYAFRKFEIKGRALYLNGKRFLIKGSNRHDWSPDKAKTAEYKWLKKDAELMKRANINFVRTSHYPNDNDFYMICARYGIAILDECNVEMHGFIRFPAIDRQNFVAPVVDRMRNMVLRDRNVPCVMSYSLGNESAFYCTIGHRAQAAEARKLDPTRYIHSEPEQGQTDGVADFSSPMYGGVDRMRGYLARTNEKRPFFFCEYAHAMGNSIGNLKGKWELIRANKDSLNGGFIWDWVDQGLLLPRNDGTGKKYISDGRDWNDNKRASAQNFCMNGIILADRNCTSKYFEVQKIYQDIQIDNIDAPNGKLKISNEFLSTNLSDFKPVVSVELNGKPIAKKTLEPINIGAGESAEVEIDLPEFDSSKAGEYFYTLQFLRQKNTNFANKGDVAAQNQFFIKKVEAPKIANKSGAPSFSDGANQIIVNVRNGGGKITFDKSKAVLSGYDVDGKKLLTSPIEFDISSAFIDNFERGGLRANFSKMSFDNLAVKDSSVISEKSADCLNVVCQKLLANDDGEGFRVTVKYSIFADGEVKVAARAHKINETPEYLPIPRLGLKMNVNKDFNKVEYFGRGPLANYSDREYGSNVGLYKSNVADWYEDFSKPQDTGNRQDVRWLALRDAAACGLIVVADAKPLPMAVLPYTQEEISAAKHPYLLPTSSANQLRVAWKVRGLGNGACGPRTREQFRCNWNGAADWYFTIAPVFSNTDAQAKALEISSREARNNWEADSKNLDESKFAPRLMGKNISSKAKVSYSSTDPQWAPKSDTMLTAMSGEYSCHTLQEDNPWLIVDMGAEKHVTGAKIYNRTTTMSQRAIPLNMYVSTDGKKWEKVWRTDLVRTKWNAVLPSPKKARFVKLQVEGNSILHLRGVEIFGM